MRVSGILWGLAGFHEVREVRPVRPLALREGVCFSTMIVTFSNRVSMDGFKMALEVLNDIGLR